MRTNQHFKFQDLNIDQLWQLRSEIILNSIYVQDYQNSFEFDPDSMYDFFLGYIDYIMDIAVEDDVDVYNTSVLDIIKKYDTPDMLWDYYCNLYPEFLCSIQYEPEWDDEDNEAYENYWNGIGPDGHDPECR